MEENIAVGIDFGTTYSCVGVWKNNEVVIIPNGLNQRTSPSIVIFEKKDKIYVCEDTIEHLSEKKTAKIYEIKRLIGKKYSEIESLKDYFSFNVVNKENKPIIKIEFDNGEIVEYTPELIATLIFKKLISNTEAYLNEKIRDVVITVPADFNNTQRLEIKSSAEKNNIKVLQIVNEPSAAALAAGYFSLIKNLKNFEKQQKNNNKKIETNSHPMEIEDKNTIFDLNNTSLELGFIKKDIIKWDEEQNYILVFDLGGGTYDLSLIEIMGTSLETITTAGNQKLGGGDFDNKLMEYCLENFSKNANIDKEIIMKNFKTMQKLKIVCEQEKRI